LFKETTNKGLATPAAQNICPVAREFIAMVQHAP
jgi:hypothetical protein